MAPAYAKAATPPKESPGRLARIGPKRRGWPTPRHPPSYRPAPPGIGERANRAAKMDIGKMSDAEFDSLSADERAKLRGDAMA